MLDTIFSAANGLAMLGWLALAIFPRSELVTDRLIGLGLPALFGAGYLWLIVTGLPGAQGGFQSLSGVATLFDNRALLLAGWVHYLAFDLFIGAWQAREARRIGLSRWLLLPCFALTFLLGPIGLLVFLGLRMLHRRAVGPAGLSV